MQQGDPTCTGSVVTRGTRWDKPPLVTSVHLFTIVLHSIFSHIVLIHPLSLKVFLIDTSIVYIDVFLCLSLSILLFITFFVNLSSFILSMCPNHLKTRSNRRVPHPVMPSYFCHSTQASHFKFSVFHRICNL